MEETKNMTAERSLQIITEQIAQSRKAVSKDVGRSLYVLGLCGMGRFLSSMKTASHSRLWDIFCGLRCPSLFGGCCVRRRNGWMHL